jgi:SAM-dependent methyltransferase
MPRRLPATTLLHVLQPWKQIEEPLHRRVAHLADAHHGSETLWIGCGSGRSVLWWAKRFETVTAGIDPDPKTIEQAEQRARDAGLSKLATFQVADPTDLPHEDRVYDTVVVHILHLPDTDGKKVLLEASRVTRPMGTVLVLVPAWTQTPTEKDVAILRGLGFSPHMSVEWKSFCRDAGIVELRVEEVATEGAWLVSGRLQLLLRGWRAAGWLGIRTVLSREVRTLCSLARKRVLGFSIIKGTRWPHD